LRVPQHGRGAIGKEPASVRFVVTLSSRPQGWTSRQAKEETMARTSAADLAHSFKGAKFPISKKDLAALARKNGAPDEIVDTIQDLPDDEFDSVTQVEHAFSQESHSKGQQGAGSSHATGSAKTGGQHSHGGHKGE
jgi:hypothetical protein